MPSEVYRATDATLVMGVDDTSSPEGQSADALVSEYDLSNAVGRLQRVTIAVSTDLKPFYEIGRRYPAHLRPGNIYVSGTADRAHVNGALLRLLLGDGAVSPPGAANFVQPAFNIITTAISSTRPDEFTKITVFGVKFESWHYQIPADDFVIESVKFQALRIAYEES
jgi:hypothetical protein